MSEYYVYILFRLNGIPCYVGKGKGNRWLRHESKPMHENKHLRSIIKQARDAGETLPKVKLREGLTEEEAFEIERTFIAAIGREGVGGPLVNLTDGGDGESGRVFSAEHRANISASKKGRIQSDSERRNRREAMSKPEVKEKVKLAMRASIDAMSPEERKSRFGNYKPTEDHIAHLAAINRERAYEPRSEETRKKISETLSGRSTSPRTTFKKGRVRSPEERRNHSEAIKASWAKRKSALASGLNS